MTELRIITLWDGLPPPDTDLIQELTLTKNHKLTFVVLGKMCFIYARGSPDIPTYMSTYYIPVYVQDCIYFLIEYTPQLYVLCLLRKVYHY